MTFLTLFLSIAIILNILVIASSLIQGEFIHPIQTVVNLVIAFQITVFIYVYSYIREKIAKKVRR